MALPATQMNIRVALVLLIGGSLVAFQLWTAAFGNLESFMQRSVHLLLAMSLIFVVYPRNGKPAHGKTSLATDLADAMLVVLTVVVLGYVLINYNEIIVERLSYVTPLTWPQKVFGLITVILVFEATRRVTGPVLSIVGLLFLAYAFLGQYLPGYVMRHGGYSYSRIIETLYLSPDGIFGIPLGVSATIIALFTIFGAVMEQTGLGKLLIDVATAIGGQFRGGPAKVAAISSAMMASINGSAVANVATTGVMTIPLMKKVGYKSHYAGAIEAVASTGGMITPPVMGSLAFIMSEYTGIPYLKIAVIAALPALLYFAGLLFMVDFEAGRTGLRGLPKSELPNLKEAFSQRWHLLIPIALLIFLLQWYTIDYAVIFSLIVLLVVAQCRKVSRLGIQQLRLIITGASRGIILVAAATATAGLIAGMFALTGLGMRLAGSIIASAGGDLLLLLLLVAGTTIVLGMGVPPTAAYIVQIAITIPVVVKLLTGSGMDYVVALAVAHYFVVYYATLAVITPPDATASFAAAGLADAPPIRTGLTAMYLGFSGYIVPLIFVYRPAILLMGGVIDTITSMIVAVLAIVALSAGMSGYLLEPMSIWERGLASIGAFLLIVPTLNTTLTGIGIIGAIGVVQIARRKSTKESVLRKGAMNI